MAGSTSGCKLPHPSLTPAYFLNKILCLLAGLVTLGRVNINLPSGNVTPAWTVYDDAGATTEGIHSVEFHPDLDYEGEIDGVPYTGADWMVIGPIKAPLGKGLGAISFTVTAGTLTTIEVPLA
jgi:hypothetical protein